MFLFLLTLYIKVFKPMLFNFPVYFFAYNKRVHLLLVSFKYFSLFTLNLLIIHLLHILFHHSSIQFNANKNSYNILYKILNTKDMSTLPEELRSEQPDGYCYTFNETLEYSLSNSWSETEDFSNDEENEGTPNCVNKNQRIWNKGTLWLHDTGSKH